MKTKVEPLATLKGLRSWRSSLGGSPANVALVSGNFHILQPGNLTALRIAKTRAGHVCVILEPDATGTAAQGDRPFISVAERAEMIAHLKDVDVVTSFPSPDEKPYLESLRPYTWFSCREQIDGPLARHAASHSDVRAKIPTVQGCFTPEVLEAIRTGKTPIRLPGTFHAGRRNLLQRKSGHTLVTVNGCFDVLHIGHLRFLAQARAMGDELIVLTNNDASVRRYKGSDRPIFPLRFRVAALMALKSVSAVYTFSEDNPLRLIAQLRPDVHVKGGTYEPGRVDEECRLLKSWGGRIAFCPMVEDRSTTAYLRRLGSRR